MANIHLILSEDDFVVSETVKKLVGDGQGLEVIDSNASTNAETQMKDLMLVDSSFSTPPFLDPIKITWWKNVGFLPQTGKGAPSEEVKKALENFAAKLSQMPPADNQKLIISGPRLLQNSVFAKRMKAVAEVIAYAPAKGKALLEMSIGRATEFADELGLKFASGADRLFVSIVGNDTRSIHSELTKMRDYLGPESNTITQKAIEEITSAGVGVEPAMWSVTDAIGNRDASKAVAAMRPFEEDSGFAILMTTIVEKFLRGLVELKAAAEAGRIDELTEGQPPWMVNKNLAFLRKWTLRELRVARARFVALRERAVSSSTEIDSLVIVEIVRFCRQAKGVK